LKDVAQAENAVESLKESGRQLSEQIAACQRLQNRLDETVVRISSIMEDMEAAEAEPT
jgi:hypothetical protein